MRFAHLNGRLAVSTDAGWVDVASATGDASLVGLSGVIASGLPVEVSGDPLPEPAPEAFGPALDRPGRIFCVGRNYVDHVAEFRNDESPWPETFVRLPTTVTGPYADIPRSALMEQLDYEGELAFVVGRGGRHIPRGEGLSHIFGFTVVNDLSVRDWQKRGVQWTAGKNFDATLPVGPVVVTADSIDASDLRLETRVNGAVVQSATTAQFIFDLGTQVEFLSSFTELQPGDLVCTGTPGGVGAARTPPLLLEDGDVVEVEVEGIGTIRNRVVDDGLDVATLHWRDVANRRAP
jgi:acylpyruvate hydrolase